MCPFLDEGDSRCAVHQSLHNLHEAMALCAGHFARCPVYQQMRLSNAPHHQLPEPIRIAG